MKKVVGEIIGKIAEKIVAKKKIIIPAVALLALLGWFGWYVWHWENREPLLEVYFFDVSKGSAIFVRTPNGQTALIGGGQGSDILRELTSVMPFYRRHIDTVIYPIEVANSIGLEDVVSRYDVGKSIHLASSTEAVHMVLDEGGGDSGNGVSDRGRVLLEGLSFGTSTNALLRLSYGNNSFVIADVLSKKDQQAFYLSGEMERSGAIRVDVLQLRSAAQTKMSSNFFEKIHPKYVVVSKMPTRPKISATPSVAATSTVAQATDTRAVATKEKVVATSSKSTKTKKSSNAAKSAKPKPPKKPAPPKDPPFDLFSYSSVKIVALDREGVVEFVSDGKSLHLIKK